MGLTIVGVVKGIKIVPTVLMLTAMPINFHIKWLFIVSESMPLIWMWKNYNLPMVRDLSAWRNMSTFCETLTQRGLL